MPDENGSRVNNGMNPTGDIVNSLLSELKNTFVGAFQQQNELLTKILNQQKTTTNYVSTFNRFGTKSVKDILNQIEDLEYNLSRLQTHTDSEITKLRQDSKKPVKSIDSLGIGKQLAIFEKYQKELERIEQERIKQSKEAEATIQKLESSIQSYQKQRSELDPSKDQELINKLNTEINSLTTQIHDVANAVQENVSAAVEQATRDKDIELDRQQRNLDKLIRSFDLAQQGNQELASISSSFGSFISKQQEQETRENANEEFMKAVKLQKETLTKYLKQINDKLKQDKSLTKEERELLGKQKQLTIDQINYLRNLNPVSDIWKKAGQDMKQVGKDLASGLLNTTLGLLKNRFLESYEKGFQSVYSSLESTRNTISARMGLNQGAFEDLINDLQKDLTSQNLEGVMSVVDLQEALVSLSSAGITDKELLKELTMDMAELKASGSSLDLSNEETLSRIVNLVKQGTTTEQLRSFFETSAAQERVIRKQYGGDTALVHGGFNTILNQVLDIGSAYGRSMEQISEDLGSSIAVAQQAYNKGLSYDYFISRLTGISQKSPQELNTEEKIAFTQGATPGLMATSGLGAAYEKIINATDTLTGMISANVDFAGAATSSLGVGMTTTEALRYGRSGGVTQTSIDESTIQEMAKSTTKALQEADWVSQTEKVMNKAENAMTDLAQTAEEYYEGDKAFLEIGHNLESTTGKILEILANAGVGTLKTALTGGSTVAAGAGSAAAATGKLGGLVTKAKGVMSGTLGTGASTAIKSLGVLGGIGIAGYNIVQDISDGGGIKDVLSDPDVYMGVGTAVGSAIAGPLGGLVGGLVGKVGGETGTWLAKNFGEPLGDLLGDWFVADNIANFNNAVLTLQEGASRMLDSATAQYASLTEQETTFKNFDTNQKRLYLLENGNLTAEEANNKDTSDINKIFKNLVLQELEAKRKEAAFEVQKKAFVKENAAGLTQIRDDFGDISKLSSTKDELTGISQQETNIYSRLGSEATSSLISMVSEFGTEGDVESIVTQIAGDSLSSKEKGMYVDYIEGILERKKKYEEANEEFQEKWKKAKASANSNDITTILLKYSEMYASDMTESSMPAIKGGWETPELVNGLPVLDYNGLYSEAKYMNKFASGLTRVPSNNYPALLHEGERVLTKRESDVYNEMSSYAMSQISSMASNSYSTAYSSKLDSESINRSINNQTSSVEQLLKQIIQMLQSISINVRGSGIDKGNSSILRMNSNITQLNTAT